MEQYVIKGGSPLVGEVEIGGAKNAALGILAAAIMTDETVTIENVPNVRDTNVLLNAIEEIGARVERLDGQAIVAVRNQRRLEIGALQRLFRQLFPARLVDGRKARILQDPRVHPVAFSVSRHFYPSRIQRKMPLW